MKPGLLFALVVSLYVGVSSTLPAQALGASLPSWSWDSVGNRRAPAPWRSDTGGTRSHTGTGLLIGGLVGAVATTVFLAGFCNDPDTQCGADEVGRAVLFIGVPPTLLGALIGSLVHTER